MLQPENDTEEFEFYLKFAKPLVLSLTDTNERIKAASWIRKLRKEDADITLRSNYLKLLLFVLQRRKLIGPFAQIPDEDKPLPDFPPDSNLQDVAKNFVEVDERILKETLKKGGYGEWPPYNTAHASDLTEYASSQAIPNFGTQVYFAVSKFPIHTWDNFNKCVVPENEKLEVKTQIGGDISPDITCFVPETRPETPGKAERVGDKSGDSDFGWLDSMKSPDVVVPKQESPERDEFDVSDRVPPTWGSNLITIQDSPTRDRSPRSQRIEDLSLPEEVEDESLETSRVETPSPSTPCVVCSESPSTPDFGGESFMSDDQKDLRWMDSMRPDAELPTDEQQDPNLWDSFDRWTEDPDQIFQQFPPSPKVLDVSNEPEHWDPALDTPPLFSRDPKIREGPGGQRIYAPQEFGMESFEEPIWKPGEEFFKRHPCQSPFFNERAQNRQTLDMSKYNAPVSPIMQKRFSDIQSGFDDAFIAEETAPDLHALSFGEDDMQAKTVAEAIIESSKIGPIDTWQPPREDLDFGDLDFLGEAPPKFIFEPLFFGTPPPYEPNPEINEEDLEESLSKLIEEDLALMNAGIPVTTPKRSPMPRRKPPLLSESPPPAPDTDFEDIQLAPSPELTTPPKYTRQPARQLDFDINIGSPIKANIPPMPPPVDTDAQEKLEMDNKLANLNRRIEILEMIGNTVNLTPPRPPPTPPPMPHLMDAQIPGRRLPSPIRAPPAEWDWKTPPDLKKPSQKRRQIKTPTGIPSPKAEKEGFPEDVGLYTESPPPDVLSPTMAMGPLLFSPEEDFMKDVCGIACPGSPVAGPSGQPMLSDWQLEQMNQIAYEDEQFEDLDETPPDLYRSPDRPITPENIRKMRQPEQAEPVFSPRTLQRMEDEELEHLELDVFGPEIAKRPQRPFRQGISPPRPVPPPTTGESPIPAEYEMRAWQQELELRAPVQRYKTKPMSVRPKPGKSCRVVKGKTPTVSPIKDLEFETNELNLSRTPPRIPAIRDTRVPVITPTRGVPPVYSNAPPSPDAIIQNGFGLPSPLRYERVPHRISSINDPEQTCAGKRKKVKIRPKKIDFDQRPELTPPRVPSKTPAAPPPIAESPTRLPPTVAPANWDRSPLRPEVFHQKTKGQLTDICRIDIPCDADLDAEEFPDLDNPRPPRARSRQRFEGEIPLPVVSVSPLSPASPETPEAEREAWKKQIKEYEKLQKRRKKKVTKPPKLESVQEEKSPKKMKTPKKYSVPRPVTPPGPTVVSEARDVLSRIAMIREQLGLLENTLQQTPQRVEGVDAEEPAAEEPVAEEPAAEEPLAEEQATTKAPAAEEIISEDSIDIYMDVETDILDTETIPDFLDTSDADICPITCGPTSEDDIGPLLTEQESLTTTGHPLFHEPVPYVRPQRAVDMEVNIGSPAPKRRIFYKAPDYRAKEGVNYEEEANAMERQMQYKENEQKLQERRTSKVLYKTTDVTQEEVEREHQEMKDMERKVANIDRRLELLETIGQSINVLPPQTPPTPPPMPHIMDESVPGRRLPPPMTMPPYNWGWKSPPDLKKVPQKKKKLLSPTRLPYSSQQGTSSQIYEDGLFAESPPNEALMEPLMLSPDADFMAEVCGVECPSSPVTGPAGQPIIQNWELEQMNDIELEQEEFADLDETPPNLYHSPPQTVDDDMDLDQEELERLELEVFGAEPIQPRTPCQGISRPQPAPTAGHSPIPDEYEMRVWQQELELMPLPRTYRQTRVMSVRPKPGKSYKVMGAKTPAGSPIKDEFEPDDRYLAHTPPRIPPIRDFRVPLITPPRTPVQSPLPTPTTPPRTGPPPNWNWVSPPQREMEYYTPEAAAVIEAESPPLYIKSPEDGRCFAVCAEDQEGEEEEYDDFDIQPPEMDVIDIAQVDSQMFDQICESPPALYTSPEQRASSGSPQRVSPRRVSPPRVSPPRVSPPRISPPGVATPRAPRTPPQRQDPQYDRQQFMDSSIYLPKVEVLNRMGVLSPETPEREREAFRTGLEQYQPVAYKKKTFSVRPKSKTVRLGAKKPSMSFVQELPYAELVTPPRRPRTQPSERTRAVPTRPTTAPCAVPYTRSPMVLSPSAARQHPMFIDSTRNPPRQIPLDTDLDVGQTINVREPERVILGDSTDEVVQEQLQYADEFERKMLNAERKQKIMTQVQEQYTMSPEQPLSMQPEEQEIIPDEDEDEPQPSMPPRGWDWSSPPEYAQPPRAKRAMQPCQTPARRQEQEVDEIFTESPPMIMYSPPTLQSSSGPCADVCPSRSPRTSPVRSPRTSPVRSPRTSPVRSPRTSPVRSPQTTPIKSPRTSLVTSPQSTTPIRSPHQISLIRPQQASPVRTPRISPVRSPGGRPVLESWPVQPIPDEFDWAANQADYSILQNEFPPALEDQSPPELPDYLKKARQQEALLYGDTSPTIQQQVMPRSRSPRATSPRARSPCAQVPETRIARSPVNTAEIEDLEMEIFGQLSPEYAPPIPKPMDLARMPTIQPNGGKRPGRRVGRVSYDPVVVDADELKDFRQLVDQVNPSTSGITYRDVMDESVPELQLDYSEISMMGNIPDYEPEVFNMFTDESLIEMDIREPFEGQPDTIFDTSIIDTELRDEDRYFKWMECNTHCPSKKK